MKIQGGLVGLPQTEDPLSAQRAAANVASGFGAAAGAAKSLGAKVENDQIRGANLFGKVEASRINRELSQDLVDLENSMPETGVGFSKAGLAAFDARYGEAVKRAGGDRLKLRRLEQQRVIAREGLLKNLNEAEREWGNSYANYTYLQNLDDSKQSVSRMAYADPATYTPTQSATGIIKKFEGFRTTPYWDVNAYRTGYGSDTVTRADGSVERVTKNTIVTEADAERDLARRTREFQGTIIGQIGTDRWSSLSESQQAALTSMAYNYGSLPKSVANAVKGGGDVAAAIRARGSDNKGVNQSRREQEANIFESGFSGGRDQFGIPHYDGVMPDLKKNQAFQDELRVTFDQIDAMNITALEKRKLRDEAEAELTMAALNSMSQTNPSAALAYLRSGALDKALAYGDTARLEAGLISSERSVLEKQLAAQAKAQEAAAKDAAYRAYQDNMAFFENPVGDQPAQVTQQQLGLLSREQRFNLEKAPNVTAAKSIIENSAPGDIPAILSGLQANANDAIGVAAYEEAVKASGPIIERANAQAHMKFAEQSGLPVNTKIDGVSDELDAEFGRVLARMEGQGEFAETDRSDILAGFVDNYGVLPKAGGELLAGLMGSDNEADRLAAVQTIAKIAKLRPEALSEIPQKLQEMGLAVDGHLNAGANMATAFDLASDATSNNPIDVARRKHLSNQIDRDDIIRAIEKIADHERVEFSTTPIDEFGMASLAGLYEDAFLRHGSKDIATSIATAAFRQAFSRSEIGGGVWMQDAPERAYSVYGQADLDADWQERDLKDFIASSGLAGAKDVTIRPVTGSHRGKPEYEVFGNVDGEMINISVMSGLWSPNVDAELVVRQEKLDAIMDRATYDHLIKTRDILERRLETGFEELQLEIGTTSTAPIDREETQAVLDVLNERIERDKPQEDAGFSLKAIGRFYQDNNISLGVGYK